MRGAAGRTSLRSGSARASAAPYGHGTCGARCSLLRLMCLPLGPAVTCTFAARPPDGERAGSEQKCWFTRATENARVRCEGPAARRGPSARIASRVCQLKRGGRVWRVVVGRSCLAGRVWQVVSGAAAGADMRAGCPPNRVRAWSKAIESADGGGTMAVFVCKDDLSGLQCARRIRVEHEAPRTTSSLPWRRRNTCRRRAVRPRSVA